MSAKIHCFTSFTFSYLARAAFWCGHCGRLIPTGYSGAS